MFFILKIISLKFPIIWIFFWNISSGNCDEFNVFSRVPQDLKIFVFEDVNNDDNYGNYSLLKFNISWLPPKVSLLPTSYSILINTLSNEEETSTICPPDENIFRHISSEQLNIILPDNEFPIDFPELTIRPTCTYEIQVIANPRIHALSNAAKMNFTVPNCVGESCHCGDAYESLPVPQVHGEILDSGEIFIEWEVNSNSSIIEYYTLSYSVPILISNTGLTVYNTTKIIQLPSNITSYRWKINNITILSLLGNKIIVSAEDKHGCLGKSSGFSIKYQVKKEPPGGVTRVSLYISIMILFSLSIGIITYLSKCNNYKLILSNNRTTLPSITEISGRVEWVNSILKKHNSLYVVHESNEISDENKPDKYEIAYERLKIAEELGNGEFGKVHLAYLDNYYKVAIKLTNSLNKSYEFEARKQLLDEIDTMKRVGSHSHLVKLLGCCTRVENPICIVLEYIEGGDLLCYLHKLRDKLIEEYVITSENSGFNSERIDPIQLEGRKYINIENNGSFYSTRCEIDTSRFCQFAVDIARGMEHLEINGIVHRDLAARNILVASNMTLKISDFGLSRDSIYLLGASGMGQRKLPARWMAPEALRDRIFTNKSDVWSYGIVLWEISTLGSFPYSEIPDDELLYQIIKIGTRLRLPDNNNHLLNSIIRDCWSMRPVDRPNFSEILQHLATPSESLNLIITSNPCYALVDPTPSYTLISSS